MLSAHDKVNIATNIYEKKRLVLCTDTLKKLYQSFKDNLELKLDFLHLQHYGQSGVS